MLTDVPQELMTPNEAARWFRRSPSWLRQQVDLLRLGGGNGQPLYHTQVCPAYVLGKLCDLDGRALHAVQRRALAAACGLADLERWSAADAEADQPGSERADVHRNKASATSGAG